MPSSLLAFTVLVSILVCSVSSYCDCDYASDGCYISDEAEPGMACTCVNQGDGTCSGVENACTDTADFFCIYPDTTYDSCSFGGGDCDGYNDADYDIKKNGNYIKDTVNNKYIAT